MNQKKKKKKNLHEKAHFPRFNFNRPFILKSTLYDYTKIPDTFKSNKLCNESKFIWKIFKF